jgi:hypothetical protein
MFFIGKTFWTEKGDGYLNRKSKNTEVKLICWTIDVPQLLFTADCSPTFLSLILKKHCWHLLKHGNCNNLSMNPANINTWEI